MAGEPIDPSRFAGHSPGPWEIDEEDGSIRTPDGFLVGHVAYHGNINTVARTGVEFNAADLQLMAAGPELLDRLSAAVRLASGAADAARAAIVAAIGRQAEEYRHRAESLRLKAVGAIDPLRPAEHLFHSARLIDAADTMDRAIRIARSAGAGQATEGDQP